MSGALVVLLILALVSLAGLLAWLSYQRAKKRREAFAAAAAQHGWGYAARDDQWTTRFSGHPFGKGHDQRALNVLTGDHDGRRFIAFDYRYSTTEHTTDAQGRSRTRTVVHPYSIVALSTDVALPPLSVSPEGFFGRIVGRLTDQDIEMESEQFNRAFTVTCPDRKFATDVLHPQMMEYLLTMPELGWGLRDGSLLTIRQGQHSLEELTAKLVSADGILDRIPNFVWQQAGGQQQSS